jgi:hypothetical protein
MEHEFIWKNWATRLKQWRLGDFAAWLLEAAGPVHLVGAQMLYLGQPLFEMFTQKGQFESITELLEKPEQAQAFVDLLREEHS